MEAVASSGDRVSAPVSAVSAATLPPLETPADLAALTVTELQDLKFQLENQRCDILDELAALAGYGPEPAAPFTVFQRRAQIQAETSRLKVRIARVNDELGRRKVRQRVQNSGKGKKQKGASVPAAGPVAPLAVTPAADPAPPAEPASASSPPIGFPVASRWASPPPAAPYRPAATIVGPDGTGAATATAALVGAPTAPRVVTRAAPTTPAAQRTPAVVVRRISRGGDAE